MIQPTNRNKYGMKLNYMHKVVIIFLLAEFSLDQHVKQKDQVISHL